MSNTDASKNKIHIEIEDDPEKWGGEMNEIEKIKERLQTYKDISTHPVLRDVQTLLSSLGTRDNEIKALEGLRISLRDEIIELESSLEKEKERADKAEKCLESERISVNQLSLANQELTERIKKLEATLALIKTDESIGKLEVEGSFGEDD